MILDVLLDSLMDVAKMIPIMFAVCLLGEFVLLKKELYVKHGNSATGIVAGALFGLVPQCGIPVGCAQLYTKKLIGLATVMAVFLSSSDEALIIAAGSYDMGFVLGLAATKVAVGVVFGLVLLLLSGATAKSHAQEQLIVHHHENTRTANIVYKTAVSVFFITVYVLAVVFILNLLIELVGLETIQQKIAAMGMFQVVVMAFIGMVPSCVSSVFVTESYMSGIISYGALISGLCANTGYGIIVIFKALPLKKALSIAALLLAISIFTGSVFMLLQN